MDERNETSDRDLVTEDVAKVQAVCCDVVKKHLLEVIGFDLEEHMRDETVEVVAPGHERVVVE